MTARARGLFCKMAISLIMLVLAFMVAPVSAAQTSGFLSADASSRLSTIPHNPALANAIRESGLTNIAVRHEGWNETLESWARIKLDGLTGRTGIHGQDPSFTVLSMMYETERWLPAKFLPVEHPKIAEMLGFKEKWVSPRQVMDSPGLPALRAELEAAGQRKAELETKTALMNAVEQAYQVGRDRPGIFESLANEKASAEEIRHLGEDQSALDAFNAERKALSAQVKGEKAFFEAANKLLSRSMMAFSLSNQFLICPDPDSITGEWLAPGQAAAGVNRSGAVVNLRQAAVDLDRQLAGLFTGSEASELGTDVDNFLRVMEQSREYPSAGVRGRWNFYTRHNPFGKAAWVYALATLMFSLYAFFRSPWMRIAGTAVLCTGLGVHTFGWVMRLVLTGHMPVSNMYESITFTAWAALLVGTIFELWKREGLVGLFSSIVGMLMLMGVSLMPLHDTRIHPLRAVLNSYWLNIHVTAMLISYGTFAVAAIVAISYLMKHGVQKFTGREALFGKKPIMSLDQTEELAYRLIQVGWPILTVGICLGAVWADTAWGRYWGWDPKETWALITWIVYTIYLHSRMVMGWKGTVSAAACLIGFVMVLITWLGVSYLPWFAGGLHTYASPT